MVGRWIKNGKDEWNSARKRTSYNIWNFVFSHRLSTHHLIEKTEPLIAPIPPLKERQTLDYHNRQSYLFKRETVSYLKKRLDNPVECALSRKRTCVALIVSNAYVELNPLIEILSITVKWQFFVPFTTEWGPREYELNHFISGCVWWLHEEGDSV